MFAHHLDWSLSTLHPSSSSSSSSSTHSHISTASSLSSTFSDSSSIPPSSPAPSRTHAFFASPFSPSPATVQNFNITIPRNPTSPRSLTADFFASPPSSARPTPPPSIYTPSIPGSPFPSTPNSREPSPSPSLKLSFSNFRSHEQNLDGPLLSAPPTHKTPRLSPLSRFLPSRYNSDPNPELGPPSRSPFARTFRDIDIDTDGTPHLNQYSNFHIDADAVDDDTRSHWQILLADTDPESPSPISPVSSPSPFTSSAPTEGEWPIALEPGTILNSDLNVDKEKGTVISLKLIRALGRGAFSCVWLARDISEYRVGQRVESDKGRLVAVKLAPSTDRIARLTFDREAEILRHISHSNIVPLLASFTSHAHSSTQDPTPALIFPYIPGSDLLDLVNSDARHSHLGEGVLRRIIRELVGVLAWLHNPGESVAVVHRDVKLENVLLTTPNPTMSTPSPLIKLTDFGLARVIRVGDDGKVELLSARCGSEAYAAPELVVGGHDKEPALFTKGENGIHGGNGEGGGWYDGRATDAWAVGVLIYALICRELPFGEGVPKLEHESTGGHWEGELVRKGESGRERQLAKERKSWLMRIARGEYEWPHDTTALPTRSFPSSDSKASISDTASHIHTLHLTNVSNLGPVSSSDTEPTGAQLAHIPGVRKLVGKLLVRDCRKRATLADLLKSDCWLVAGKTAMGVGVEKDGKVQGIFQDVAWREFE